MENKQQGDNNCKFTKIWGTPEEDKKTWMGMIKMIILSTVPPEEKNIMFFSTQLEKKALVGQ